MKDQFVQSWQNEFATTLRVLKAFPADKAGFKPHEKSQDAIRVAWNFVLGQIAIQQALDQKFTIPPDFPPTPDRWEDLISRYESENRKLLQRLERAVDADLQQTMKFPVSPKEMKDIPTLQFLWFVFCDGIHHRGQLSVYLRLAGGKVPSIYGPSADEPWM